MTIKRMIVTAALPLLAMLVACSVILGEANPEQASEPWRNNKIGISEVPPPPFTPIRVRNLGGGMGNSGFVVECWGREYRLGDLGLPAEITSSGVQMLAGPVSFSVRSDQGASAWQSQDSKLVKADKVQAILSGEATSAAGRLAWKCTAEYDGVLRYDLSFEPAADATITTMELSFPLTSQVAKLSWRHCAQGQELKSSLRRALPSSQGVLDDQSWIPYLWWGDQERGLAIFCETDEAWQSMNGKPGFRLERTDDAVQAVWSFANGEAPWKIAGKWRFTFGLEATPVKDITGWRRWRAESVISPSPGICNLTYIWSQPQYATYYGYPEATDPEYYRKVVDGRHAGGSKVLPYVLLRHLSEGSPEAKYLPQWSRYEWGNPQDVFGRGEDNVISTGRPVTVTIHNPDETFSTKRPVTLVLRYPDPYIHVAPTPDWIDFIVWKCNQFVLAMNLDGLYVDFANPAECTNPAAGFGYDRDGQRHPQWPFFANRELYKRIYTMLKDYRRDTFFFAHMSYNMFVPYLAFCDGTLDGEHMGGSSVYADKDYPEILPMDAIQAEYMGHNYGIAAYFLPLPDRRSWKDWPSSERYIIGMSLLHDFGLMHGSEAMKALYRVFDEFGIADADFLPYWRNGDLVSGQSEAIKTSAYRKPSGGALVVICNTTRQAQSAALSVDWGRLKSDRSLEVFDAYTKEPVAMSGKAVTLDVPPINYRLLWVR